MSTGTKVVLPDFTGKRCEMLVVCGSFRQEDGILHGFTADYNLQYVKLKPPGRKSIHVLVNRFLTAPDKNAHLHVDFSTVDRAPKPKARHNLITSTQLRAVLDPLLGRTYDVKVSGHFTATRAELPAVVRYALEPAQAGGVKLQMYSGWYTVVGAPVQGIRWMQMSDPEKFDVVLEAYIEESFGPTYFEDMLEMVEDTFAAVFPGERRK